MASIMPEMNIREGDEVLFAPQYEIPAGAGFDVDITKYMVKGTVLSCRYPVVQVREITDERVRPKDPVWVSALTVKVIKNDGTPEDQPEA